MFGFPMMILQLLRQEGPLTAAQITTALREKAERRVLESSLQSTLKNMESCNMIGRMPAHEKDQSPTSRMVVVYTILPAGQARAEQATRNIQNLN